MPAERSLYRKIQEVLEVTKSVKVSNLTELRAEIAAQHLIIFQTPQYDSKRDTFVDKISERVIHHTVRMCCVIGLLSPAGSLTDVGRRALRRANFDEIVGDQIKAVLSARKIQLSQFNKLILTHFHSQPPLMPTCRELWREVATEISYGMFSRLLTLLANCGAAQCSQKRLYLHFDND